MLSSFYAPHKGGTEKYVEDLSAHLVKRGHEVTVFTHSPGDSQIHRGIKIVRIPALWFSYIPVPTDRISNISVLNNFDVINSHVPPSVFSLNITPSATVSHIITYHCDPVIPQFYKGFTVPGWIRKKLNDYLKKKSIKALNMADSIIVTSDDYASTSDIVRGKAVIPVPIGVDHTSFSCPLPKPSNRKENIPMFLYVGRLAAGKGIDILLKAASILMKSEQRFKLEIVGEGEELRSLKAIQSSYGLDEVITFHGRLCKKDLIMALHNARSLVLPSVSRLEAFGIVQLEAFCNRTPVIISNLPGVRQIVKDTNGGWLFPPGDAVALAERMRFVIENENEAYEAGIRGFNSLESRYNWDIIASQIEDIYKSCLNRQSGS